MRKCCEIVNEYDGRSSKEMMLSIRDAFPSAVRSRKVVSVKRACGGGEGRENETQ